jgi:hypothetical protein
LADTAPGLGLLATELSAFQLTARAAGVDSASFGGAITRLNNKLTDAASGGKDSIAVFKALGIELRDGDGQLISTSDALRQVADRFASYRDGAEKSALATELFGKSGAKLIAFLNEGSAGLDKFGGASKDAIDEAARLQGQIDKLAAGWEKLWIAVAGRTAAVINTLTGANGFDTKPIEERRDIVAKTLEGVEKELSGIPQQDIGTRRKFLEAEVRRLRGVLEGLSPDDVGAIAPRAPVIESADSRREREAQEREAQRAAENAKKEAARAEEERLKRSNEIAATNVKNALAQIKTDQEIEDQRIKFDTAEAERAQAFVDRQAQKLEALQLELGGEEDIERRRFELRMEFLEELAIEEPAREAEIATLRLQVEQDYQDRVTQLRNDAEAKRLGVAKVYRQLDLESATAFLGQMAALMNTNSRKMFEIGKAAAIGETIIKTYSAAVKSYDWAASFSGPIGGAIAAAAAVAAGLANVQRIKSTPFGGGALTASSAVTVPGQGPFDTSPPVTPVQPQAAPAARSTQITIVGSSFSAQQVRELIEAINEQVGLGATLTVQGA